MKSCRVCVLVLFFVIGVCLPSQAREKTLYGLKLGVNIARVDGDVDSYVSSHGSRTCMSFGGFASIRQFGNLYLQPEFLYAEKGAKGKRLTGAEITASLGYLEIPVLLKYRFVGQSGFGIGVFAGPAVDLLISANLGSDDMMDFVQKIDGALVVGGGIEIPAGKGLFSLEGRYIHGFNNVDDDKAFVFNAKNRVASIMLGYSFNR